MESVKMLTLACIVITCWHSVQAVSLEPEFTKYQFIEQVIERMVRMSDKMDEFVKKMDNFQKTMDQWKDKMEAINRTVTQTLLDIEAYNREFKSNLTATNKEFSDEMRAWRENTQLIMNDSFVDFNERTSIALANIRNDNREFKSNLTAANNDAHQKMTEWQEKSEKELNDTVIGIKAKTNERLGEIEADYREFKSNLTTVNKAFQTEIGACRGTVAVAFNVYRTTGQSLSPSQPVVFNTVHLNTCGNCYSTTTGIFTAPVGGIYQFNSQLCADKGGDLDYQLVVNDVIAIEGEYRTGSDSNDMKCTSFSVVSQVDKGHTVSVRGYNHPLNANSNDELSFSGVLVIPQ